MKEWTPVSPTTAVSNQETGTVVVFSLSVYGGRGRERGRDRTGGGVLLIVVHAVDREGEAESKRQRQRQRQNERWTEREREREGERKRGHREQNRACVTPEPDLYRPPLKTNAEQAPG